MRRLDGWFWLSRELGLPLRECMARITHSEFRLWMAHREVDFGNPDRSDAYMMQVALHVVRGYAKNPGSVKLSDFILKGEDDEGPPPDPMLSKMAWLAVVGPVTEVKADG